MNKPRKDTSWGEVARPYSDHLENDPDTYQRQVILPNLLRLMKITRHDRVFDLACGQGFFTREFHKLGAKVIGADISPELIAEARKLSPPAVEFLVGSAEDLSQIESGSFNKISCVLAIQNIEPVRKVIDECARILSHDGKMYLVMNHPAFRIPDSSSWVFDEKTETMSRRIDSYLSESRKEIIMDPGESGGKTMISFHRPLQWYFKIFANAGLAVTRFEEWISHKKSAVGPRQKEEDRTRKEFPLFLFLELMNTK